MSDIPALKPIPGYEDHYAASEDGRVFSLNYRRTGKIHELDQSSLFDKRRSSESMYRRVKAYFINANTPTPVHRLIAMAWVPNPLGLPMVKLTEAQAREIKAKVANPYRGQLDELAIEYGVSKHCIFDIKRGKSWRAVA